MIVGKFSNTHIYGAPGCTEDGVDSNLRKRWQAGHVRGVIGVRLSQNTHQGLVVVVDSGADVTL